MSSHILRGITVNAVASGPVGTDLLLRGKSEAEAGRMAGMAPLGRIGEPGEIAEVAAVGPADLIVASGGINGPIRESLSDHFEPAVETRRNRFAWYGTTHLFDAVTLIFRPDRAGTFIAHSYQYSPGLSTFLVGCSPETWEAAGLDRATDEESRAYCEAVFAADLHGAPLLSKRSDWFLANIVSNRRWSAAARRRLMAARGGVPLPAHDALHQDAGRMTWHPLA